MTQLIPPRHVHDHLTHPRYRPDIDGLRAVAILSVIAFHAFPGLLRGGFIGVDIFFVISGFLISTIIIGSLERGSFSFIDFYRRRIRRIFPALALVLVTCYAVGWHTLLADEFRQLGKHIASGAGFIANFMYWSESGYFDRAADTKPLLHLWSLGVEEQYYFVWPLLLWLGWKRRLNLLGIALAIAFVSFALCYRKVLGDKVAAFYFPHTRFWELLAGSILAYMDLHRKVLFSGLRGKLDAWLGRVFNAEHHEPDGRMVQNVYAFAGAFFLVLSVTVIEKDRHFPAPWGLLPVLGAVLVIAAGPHTWINRVLLSSRVMVGIGLISYPLYLWHWPLLSFARILNGETPTAAVRLAAILAAFFLAWMTYLLIERPIRSRKPDTAKVAVLATLMCGIAFSGYNVFVRDGYSFRPFQKQFASLTKSMVRPDEQRKCTDGAKIGNESWYCTLGDKTAKPRYFVSGDSHAFSMLPALEKFADDNHATILFSSESACPPLLGVQLVQNEKDSAERNCVKFNERIFDYVKDHGIRGVILIARWTYYTGGKTKPDEVAYLSEDLSRHVSIEYSRESFDLGLRATIARYKSIGVRVYIVEDNAQQIFTPADAIRRHMLTGEPVNHFSVSLSEHREDQQWVTGEFNKLGDGWARFLNADDMLCDSTSCPLMKNGMLLYFDDDHLSTDGAMLVYPKLASFLLHYR